MLPRNKIFAGPRCPDAFCFDAVATFITTEHRVQR
jgi:hypothetical protein